MAKERWMSAATEILGAPAEEAVPLARIKDGATWYFAAGAVIFGAVIFLDEFFVIPGPTLAVYFVGALAMSLFLQLGMEPVFAVLTPTGIQMVSSTRWIPKPVAPVLGPLDPSVVSGPHTLLRNAFDVSGIRHRVPIWQRDRFQRMLEAAVPRPTG